jgi:hypothetical protein
LSGRAINDKVRLHSRIGRALVEARRQGGDPFAAIEAVLLREMSERPARKVPADAPTSFVRQRWKDVVFTREGIDRRFYELCVLSESKNALRSGDVWIPGSRQYRDFEAYLLPARQFRAQLLEQQLGLAVPAECERYLEGRLRQLESALDRVETLAAKDELPDATLRSERLKMMPLTNSVPERPTR